MIALAAASAVLLAIIWVGYPAFMRLTAMFVRPQSAVEPESWPSVTAIVASRETAEAIRARAEDLIAADYAGSLDVVVALDAAAGAIEAALAPMPRVRVVRGDAPGGKAAALNAGVRAAAGDILVFTDTHQRFAPDAIRRLVTALADGRYAATSGQLELPGHGGASLIERYWKMERRLRRDEAAIHSAVGVSGSIYAMHRAFWAPLPAGLILDDLYLPMRLVLDGRRIGFTETARAFETRRSEPAGEYRRKVRTLTGNFQLIAWLPGVLVPLRNPVWLQFVFHKLLRLLTPYLLLVGLVAAALAVVQRFGWIAVIAGAAAVVSLGGALALVGKGGAVRNLVSWVVSTQAAVVAATYNGLRGRWNVWHRTG